jgi:hypothetical protein
MSDAIGYEADNLIGASVSDTAAVPDVNYP